MIKSGTIQLPYVDPMTGMTSTWTLNAGTGPRTYLSPDIQYVPASGLGTIGAGSPFASPPIVVLSLAGVDATGGLPRVSLSVENVQAEEFNIRVNVFEDCTVNTLSVTWVAHDGV